MDNNQLFRDAVMLRTYCREVDGKLETPDQVYQRVLAAFETYYKEQIDVVPWFRENPHWKQGWFERMRTGKALPAGRMLWSMGSSTVEKEGFLPLMNCAFVPFDDPVRPLVFMCKMLMLGCGVGFSVESRFMNDLRHKFYKMRTMGYYQEGFIRRASSSKEKKCWAVPDSREGWFYFIEHVIVRAIQHKNVVYSLELLRPEGSPIKGFGGRSGDPGKLGQIAERIYDLISGVEDSDQMVETYYDVACSLGELIVSGNVRRSALIAIGDASDERFLSLKKFSNFKTKPWRAFCNNSVNVRKFEDLSGAYWDTFNGESEPYGWVNVETSQYQDMTTMLDTLSDYVLPEGFNPCAEQPLAPYEVCCLGEINLLAHQEEDDLFESMVLCYFFCKFAYTLGAAKEHRTHLVCHRNQRIGISLSGIAASHVTVLARAVKALKRLRTLDDAVSRATFVNPSIALSTVKPGGTLSKVSGCCGAGIHRPYAQYQIRRVRFPANSRMLPWFKKCGLHIEPALGDASTMVVSFYLKNVVPRDGNFADWVATDQGFKETVELVALVQETWSDNAVSCTVYYDKEKVDTLVKPVVKEYFDKLKCFSGLPYFGHGFPQAPEEEITEQEYLAFVAGTNPVPYEGQADEDHETPVDFGLCGINGACSDR